MFYYAVFTVLVHDGISYHSLSEYCQAPNHQTVPELLVPVEPGTPTLSSCLAHPKKHKGPQPTCCEIAGLERTPIQNSPWKETSLDKPYEKPKKPSLESSNVSRYRSYVIPPLSPLSLLWGSCHPVCVWILRIRLGSHLCKGKKQFGFLRQRVKKPGGQCGPVGSTIPSELS